MWPSWPPYQALYWTNPSSSDCLKETKRTGKICPQQHGSNRLSSWPHVRATGCWKFGWFVWPHRLGKLRGRLLTSTLRQGPIYTYNIFSLLEDDPVLKIGEEVNLSRKNVARARARKWRNLYFVTGACDINGHRIFGYKKFGNIYGSRLSLSNDRHLHCY